ncbi:MAG: hypothetical protein HUJ53_09955, partial [Holdemanella sp.]|nr:hypothetical protein [Holdemanella sp.]
MSIYDALKDENLWEQYYNYKIENNHLTLREQKDLKAYIKSKEYISVLDRHSFSMPEKKCIQKMQTDKKRVVYLYPREENYIFKLLTFLLVRKYDYVFSDSLYSFRVNTGVHRALKKIIYTPKINKKYSYKVDISNYFNSIPVDNLLVMLKEILDEQEYQLFDSVLSNRKVIYNDKIIEEDKGVMAGIPFAVFLANIYLMPLDKKLDSLLYARYSDDIIIFTD